MKFAARLLAIAVMGAIISGCGGGQTSRTGLMPQSTSPAHRTATGHSWMLPEAKAEDLLYVADDTGVSAYTYPQAKLVGTIKLGTGYYPAGGGLCTDKKGNVFVLGYGMEGTTGLVYEYAHGGTSPIAILDDSGFTPLACSVDRTTGNLAVTNSYIESGGHLNGNVAVYQKARGSATVYSDSTIGLYKAPAYDDKGNLFITGYSFGSSSSFTLAEFPIGGSNFMNLAVDAIAFQYDAGPMQWDGKYLAIAAAENDVTEPMLIYRVQVTGSTGSIVKTISFNNWRLSDSNFCIRDGRLITNEGGDHHAHWKRVGFWDYPAGGKLLTYFSVHQYAGGVAVSVAPEE